MNSIRKYTAFLITMLAFSTLMVSCVRDNGIFNTETKEFARKQLVRISDAVEDDIVQRARNVNPTIDTFMLLEITRSPNDNAQLNQPLTVSLTRDTSIIGRYNRAHASSFIELPSNLYTVLGDLNNITFAPGETAKQIMIRLDKTNLDLSKQYALAYRVNTGSADATASGAQGTVMYAVGVKNPYDGVYSVVSGRVQRYTDPATQESGGNLNGSLAGNPDVELVTAGANTVEIVGLQWASGSNSGVGGIAGLQATVDPVTNKVTMRAIGNPTLRNWTGKDNYYDPATKTFYLAFDWNQTANRREYEVVLKYSGPR